MVDDKRFSHSHEETTSQLRNLEHAVSEFNKVNPMVVSRAVPELISRLQDLTAELAYYSNYLYSRSKINNSYQLTEQFIRNNKGVQIRSALPLPNGEGMQLNIESTTQKSPYKEGDDETPSRISVAVYLDTNDEGVQSAIFREVDNLTSALGYDSPEDIEVERGSILRKSWARLRGTLTSDEMKMRAAKAERALELQGLYLPQAEADFKIAQAIHSLIVSLTDVPNACIRDGSILLVKYQTQSGATVFTRVLSPVEVMILERFPEIQKEPAHVLDQLALALSSWDDNPTGEVDAH